MKVGTRLGNLSSTRLALGDRKAAPPQKKKSATRRRDDRLLAATAALAKVLG